MQQNIALLLYLAAAICAECLPVMAGLIVVGLVVQVIKTRPCRRQPITSARDRNNQLQYSPRGRIRQGGAAG